MTTRTRSSPKNRNNEIDENDANISTASLNAPKKNLLKTRLIYLACFAGFGLLAFSVFQVGYIYGQRKLKRPDGTKETAKPPGPTNEKKTSSSEAKLELKMHWAGSPISLYSKYDEKTDVCYLLQHCFKGITNEYNTKDYPDDPFKKCHEDLDDTLKYMDSGFMFEGDKVVGFASINRKDLPTRAELRVYNVCVRKEERGKGVARQMVPQLIKAVKEKRITDKDKSIFAGLSVNFGTDSSVMAFATYAKLGFIRSWKPCGGAHEINFELLELQEDSNIPSVTIVDFILRRQETMKRLFVPNSSGKFPVSVCMTMKVGSDDFSTIGSDFKNYVKAIQN